MGNISLAELLLILLPLVFWIAPIYLGVILAKKKGRSPLWMLPGVCPVVGWIMLAVVYFLPAETERQAL